MKEKSYELLSKLGYQEKEIENILTATYLTLTDETLYKKIESNYNFFLLSGYSKQQIRKMTSLYPNLYSYNKETIQQKINNLIDLGYTKEQVLKITSVCPSIYGCGIKNIQQKIDNLIDLGYTKEQVLKMTGECPSIYSYSIKNIQQKIDNLISLGYTKEQVLKMTSALATIYCLKMKNIQQKIEDLISLGYTKEQVLKMTTLSSAIYSYRVDNMHKKIDDLMALGYTKEQVLKMTTELPTLFGLNIKNISNKVKFYDSINMHELAVLSPKYLMQSVKLSYARNEFLKRKDVFISINNYRELFSGEKGFKSKYGIDNKTVLELYPYENYLKILRFYERLNILYNLNPNEATKLIENEVQKYLDDNNSIEKRKNNTYCKMLNKTIKE